MFIGELLGRLCPPGPGLEMVSRCKKTCVAAGWSCVSSLKSSRPACTIWSGGGRPISYHTYDPHAGGSWVHGSSCSVQRCQHAGFACTCACDAFRWCQACRLASSPSAVSQAAGQHLGYSGSAHAPHRGHAQPCQTCPTHCLSDGAVRPGAVCQSWQTGRSCQIIS